jgi:hypothetical protein
VDLDELEARARTRQDSLGGLQRWVHVVVEAGRVRSTAAGRRAPAVWPPLVPLIEARGEARVGSEQLCDLRATLLAVLDQLDGALPDHLPVIHPTQDGR